MEYDYSKELRRIVDALEDIVDVLSEIRDRLPDPDLTDDDE
jgi:hypothetical protein